MINLPHGEYNITNYCENACLACNHYTPVQTQRWFKDPAVIQRDLEMAAKIMHFHDFCIIGGEPTLHKRLLEILDITRESGVTDRVKVNSHGQTEAKWTDEFYKRIQVLQISPYKINAEQRQHITEKAKEFGVELGWQDLGFRKVGYKVPDYERGKRLFNNCWYRFNRHVIEDGYFYYCCVGRWIPESLLGLPREVDAIALDGLTEERLKEFLAATEPIKSCAVCCSNLGPIIGWSEERDRTKWMEGTLI